MVATASPRAARLVGREEALGALREALVLGDGGGALVLGEAGIGKSRLVAALVASAREQGRRVLIGQADPGTRGITLGPLQDAVRGWLRDDPGSTPADPLAAALPGLLLPELGARERGPAERGALFEAAVRFVRALAAPPGVVLVLEDLHWADATTHDLVPYLLRTAPPAPVSVLLTMRPDDPDATAGATQMRAALARGRLAREIALGPLGDADAAEMLADVLGRDPGADGAPIVALAAGNPFALEELARAAQESGRLDPSGGGWSGAGVPLPWSLSESIRARASRLAPDERSVLRLAAALGPRFDVRLLSVAAERPAEEVLSALAGLVAAGMLVRARDDPTGQAVEFRHGLTQAALVQDELPAVRAALHRRALVAAEALREGGEEVAAGTLATHARGCGDRRRAHRYSADAARESLRLGGWAEAAGHLAVALETWAPEEGVAARARLASQRARILDRMSRGAETLTLLQEAEADFLAAGDPVAAAVAHADAAAFRVVMPEGFDEGHAELVSALERLGPSAPRPARLRVLAHLATAELVRGSNRAALAWAERADVGEDDPLDPSELPDRIELLATRGGALTFLGRQAEGRRLQAASLALARRHGDHLGLYRGLLRMVLAHRATMTTAESAALAGEAVALTRAWGLDGELATALAVRAAVDADAGEWAPADAGLAEAERLIGHLGEEAPQQLLVARYRAGLLLGRGEWDAARAAFVALAGRSAEEGWIWSEILARAGAGRCDLLAGRRAPARRALATALGLWRDAGGESDPEIIEVLAAAVLSGALGRGAGDADAAAVLAHFAEDPTARGARAVLWRDPGWERELAAAASGLARLGRRPDAAALALEGAEELAAAGCRDPAAGLAEQALAVFAGLGVEPGAARARAVLRSLGRRPTTRAALAGRAGLTGREREVLGLLGDGHTNRQIAERLVLSEATVIRHVSNIFRKLDVHSRAQAVRVGADRGLLPDR